jgi:hypothetical protein
MHLEFGEHHGGRTVGGSAESTPPGIALALPWRAIRGYIIVLAPTAPQSPYRTYYSGVRFDGDSFQ